MELEQAVSESERRGAAWAILEEMRLDCWSWLSNSSSWRQGTYHMQHKQGVMEKEFIADMEQGRTALERTQRRTQATISGESDLVRILSTKASCFNNLTVTIISPTPPRYHLECSHCQLLRVLRRLNQQLSEGQISHISTVGADSTFDPSGLYLPASWSLSRV